METTSITQNIPTAIMPDLIDAIAYVDSYEVNKQGNETKIQFAKRLLRENNFSFFKDKLDAHKQYLASQKAVVDSNTILTELDKTTIT